MKAQYSLLGRRVQLKLLESVKQRNPIHLSKDIFFPAFQCNITFFGSLHPNPRPTSPLPPPFGPAVRAAPTTSLCRRRVGRWRERPPARSPAGGVGDRDQRRVRALELPGFESSSGRGVTKEGQGKESPGSGRWCDGWAKGHHQPGWWLPAASAPPVRVEAIVGLDGLEDRLLIHLPKAIQEAP